MVEGGSGASESDGASADTGAEALLEQAAQCLANALVLADAPDDAGGTAVHDTGHSKQGTVTGADGGAGTLDTQAGLAGAPADTVSPEADAGLLEGGQGAAASSKASCPAEGSLPDPGSAAAGVTGPAAAPAAADDRTEQSEPAQSAAAAAAMLCPGVLPRPWCLPQTFFTVPDCQVLPPTARRGGRAAFIDVAETPTAIISKPEHHLAAVGTGVTLPDRGAATAEAPAAAATALLRASAHAASAWVGLRRGDPRGALKHARWLLQACPLPLNYELVL